MEKLVEVTRGPLVESVHRGSIAVVDAHGKLLAWAGEPEQVTYYRSSAKPIQAIPVVVSGAADKFDIQQDELAIICSSHSGEQQHVQTVGKLLERVGLNEEFLLCGIHPPFHRPSAEEIYRKGNQPGPIHCNCSGKHSGMLALCQYYGWPLDNYLDLTHPLQKMLLETMHRFLSYEKIVLGVDGCGVPVYGMPLKIMAKGYARLVNPQVLPDVYQLATKRLVAAMLAYPNLVGGTGRFDTELMETAAKDVLAKGGAEGVQCLGLVTKGLGIAIKIEDGNARAAEPVAIEVLNQLGVLSDHKLYAMRHKHHPMIKNHRNEVVGELRPVFKLHLA